MAEVSLRINGKPYSMTCDDGQEKRVFELGQYIDARARDIVRAGAAGNEAHLFVLTALVLADEIFELKETLARGASSRSSNANADDESTIINAIDHLAARIDSIAERLQKI